MDTATHDPLDRKIKSNRNIIYACGQCKRVVGRDNLKVKRVVFREMGEHGNVVQSRTVAWLCVIPIVYNKYCLEQ